MELGQRIRAARLEQGLSQRQLCGTVITRNMLSQIENGSARPSMDTLSYLAAQLGKPVSFFLEENAVTSPNQQVMEQARQAFRQGEFGKAREILNAYREPDSIFDWEKSALLTRVLLELAQQVLAENRLPYAGALLQETAREGEKTPYYAGETEMLRQMLLIKAGQEGTLPDVDEVLVCRAADARKCADWDAAGRFLDACICRDQRWNLLRGQVFACQRCYAQAVPLLRMAEETYPEAIALLEQCYSALEDYKMAYLYACKQKGGA